MPNLNLLKNIKGLKNSKALKNIREDLHIGPIIWIGLTMIVIYFFFDNSFPILPIIVIVCAIYLVDNNLPIGKIMIIVLCIYLLYHALRVITFVISGRCGQHRPALMLERFANNNYSSLRTRLKSLDTKIAKSSSKVDSLRTAIEGLRPDICAILKQIDESVEGDYNSNIPEEENKLPAEKQQQRAAERAKKAKQTVAEKKAIYVKNHDNIPILECFGDISDEDMDNTAEKDAINADISLTEESLNSLVSEFSEVKGLLGGNKNNSYKSTLNYNDRYIKKMQRDVLASVSKSEGFLDSGSAAVENNPTLRTENLEDRYNKIDRDILALVPIIDKYLVRVKQQKTDIDTAKGPVNNDSVQKKTLDTSYNAQKTKA